jgi:hypothetical protein
VAGITGIAFKGKTSDFIMVSRQLNSVTVLMAINAAKCSISPGCGVAFYTGIPFFTMISRINWEIFIIMGAKTSR